MVVGMFAVSFYYGYRDKLIKEEVEQHLFELELRECEADMDLAELRSDILRFSMKYEPGRLVAAAASQEVEDAVGEGGLAQQSTVHRRYNIADGYSTTLLRHFPVAGGYRTEPIADDIYSQTSTDTTSFDSAR